MSIRYTQNKHGLSHEEKRFKDLYADAYVLTYWENHDVLNITQHLVTITTSCEFVE